MLIKKLKVTLKGPLWSLDAFEIEGVNVISRWQEDAANDQGSVTVTDFNLSTDSVLDIFIKVGAPNRSAYEVTLAGETEFPTATIKYTEKNLEVTKSGTLNILISKPVEELTIN